MKKIYIDTITARKFSKRPLVITVGMRALRLMEFGEYAYLGYFDDIPNTVFFSNEDFTGAIEVKIELVSGKLTVPKRIADKADISEGLYNIYASNNDLIIEMIIESAPNIA